MANRRNTIHRRTLLRGLGASVALPFLNGMTGANAAFANAPAAAPIRMAFFYVPNGKHLPDWFPDHAGPLVDLPPTLKPMSFARDQLTTFWGLTHNNARSNGDRPDCDHARGSATFLTGAQALRGRGSNVGISVDQLAAKHLGTQTRLPSLELGLEANRQGGNSNSAYKANVSWSSPSTPAPYEINPKNVFDRLFANGDSARDRRARRERDYLRQSVLSYVAEQTQQLEKGLGREDRDKLDQYLTGVRDVERRIQSTGSQLTVSSSTFVRPEGIPKDFTEHVNLLTDLLVLAFQTDSTRVASMIFAEEANNRSYPFLGFADGHHDMSHHGGEVEKQKKLRKIDYYHVSLLAHFIEKLRATPEGDGNLLDHSMILYGSGLSDGDRHDHGNLPIALIGGAGGAIKTGRHYQLRSETPMCNLFLSMLHIAGVPVERFGDSTEPLKECLA